MATKPPVTGWLVAMTGKHKGEDFRIREGKTTVGGDTKIDVVPDLQGSNALNYEG